ncbi:hypothetical protein MMC21_002068 [Puttea exsequens]|nr:hypothetical protein [Puttea exsequens]
MTPKLRKTRFVCVSDTHNAGPPDSFKLPKGDVLIHAGDLTKQGTFSELRKTLDWIEEADFEVKLVVAGNHDITLDAEFYKQYGQYFHNQHPQNSTFCTKLVKSYNSITFLDHEVAHIRLQKEDGPRTAFNVFGSPYSPANGPWAFGYEPQDAAEIWNRKIPLNVDVMITHTPPRYHCDESRDRGPAGCERLREKLWRLRPSLFVCGHVHEGRGVERVLWDLDTRNVQYKEKSTSYWTDPGAGNKKQSLADLTSKSGAPLANTGSWGSKETPFTSTAVLPKPPHPPLWRKAKDDRSFVVESPMEMPLSPQSQNIIGQGGVPPSGRCDLEALAGRLGRKETCIVNAAIMASSWPYTSTSNGRYNKPIVVCLDLPVWQQDAMSKDIMVSDLEKPLRSTEENLSFTTQG